MSKIIRITDEVWKEAVEEKKKQNMDYMNRGSWFSFLIKKGLEKLKEENRR